MSTRKLLIRTGLVTASLVTITLFVATRTPGGWGSAPELSFAGHIAGWSHGINAVHAVPGLAATPAGACFFCGNDCGRDPEGHIARLLQDYSVEGPGSHPFTPVDLDNPNPGHRFQVEPAKGQCAAKVLMAPFKQVCGKTWLPHDMASQSHEDVAAFLHLMRGSECPRGDNPGSLCGEQNVAVEIGGLDGRTYSNTWFFSRVLGWKTILIEAGAANFAKLEKNRPSPDVTIHAAICPGKEVNFNQGDAIGSIDSADCPDCARHNARWNKEQDATAVAVPCKTFRSIFRDNQVTAVHLMSVDVEGAELMVLQQMDWDVRVRLFVVE